VNKYHKCDNCGRVHHYSQLKLHYPAIPDLFNRLSPGDRVPSGTCGLCGGLAHEYSGSLVHPLPDSGAGFQAALTLFEEVRKHHPEVCRLFVGSDSIWMFASIDYRAPGFTDDGPCRDTLNEQIDILTSHIELPCHLEYVPASIESSGHLECEE
jgi:hypothetical protein